MNILAYCIVNLLLFSSWYIFLCRTRHGLSLIDRVLGTFVLSLAQIIVTEMVLGVLFRSLFAGPLFFFNIAVSAVVLAAALIMGRREISQNYSMEELVREVRRDPMLLSVFCLLSIAVCWVIFLGYLFPSYTWDALWYHLPIVGYILQSGAIQENATPSLIDLWINIFPKNIELFFLWNTIFLKSRVLSDLSQLPFAIAGVLAIYGIAIKLGIRQNYALFSSLLFFFTPIVMLQSTTNYIDVAVAALFLIGINFLLYDRTLSLLDDEGTEAASKTPILLAGLSMGILLGSKGSGPLFLIVLSAMVLLVKIMRDIGPFKTPSSEQRSNRFGRSIVFYAIYFIIPALVMGGYWYVKNWVLYDNPVYPIEVSVLNVKVFKGLFGGIIDPMPKVIENLSPVSRPFYSWMEKVHYYLYDSRLSGFGPLWLALLLPSIAVALPWAIGNRKYGFLFVGLVLSVMFVVHPRNWYPRYVIFILGLGCLSFGITLQYFQERARILKFIALLLVIYAVATANSPCVMPLKIKEFLGLPREDRTIARHAPFNIDLQARQEYGVWMWVSANMKAGDVLAYTFEPLFLAPLWNDGYSNRTVHVKSEDFEMWRERLVRERVDYVLIRRHSSEEKWIEKREKALSGAPAWLRATGGFTDRFETVYSDDNYSVQRFRR